MQVYKLGKLPPIHDRRTLLFEDYAVLPRVPVKYEWSKAMTDIGMMQNDVCGDCTFAAMGHDIQLWTANTGNQIIVSDDDIISGYSAVSGYNPSTGENDNGCNELDVLKYMNKTGIAGHKIGAYVSVNPQKLDHIKAACYLFGGVYLGIALPNSAQGQDRWQMPTRGQDGRRGSWGGHCVPLVDIYADYSNVITWGQPLQMDWDFFSTYCDEAWAIISPDFFVNEKSPIGFNMTEMLADQKIITS